MSEQPKEKITYVDGKEITIHTIEQPGSFFTAAYQNENTRELDEIFGLGGNPVEADSDIEYDLNLAVGHCSLGEAEVEPVLRYFVFLAKQAGNFVGVQEEELRNAISGMGHIYESDLNRALEYRDGANEGKPYLIRINVEGNYVLFPANLQKQYI